MQNIWLYQNSSKRFGHIKIVCKTFCHIQIVCKTFGHIHIKIVCNIFGHIKKLQNSWPYQFTRNLGICHPSLFVSQVKRLCEGKQQCSIRPTSAMFGVGTFLGSLLFIRLIVVVCFSFGSFLALFDLSSFLLAAESGAHTIAPHRDPIPSQSQSQPIHLLAPQCSRP